MLDINRTSPAILQEILGYKDPKMTMEVYTHLAALDLPTEASCPRSISTDFLALKWHTRPNRLLTTNRATDATTYKTRA